MAAPIQATAGSVQALKQVYDTFVNVFENDERLKNSKISMEKKIIKLRIIRAGIEDKFRIYWFPRNEIDLWVSSAINMDREVNKLLTKCSKLKRHFLLRLPQFRLVQEMNTMCEEIDKVIEKGEQLEDAMVTKDTKRIVKVATSINIENIPTFMRKLDEIIRKLRDERVYTIRVCGFAGRGKRVLIQYLNNHKEVADMFDIVLYIRGLDPGKRGKDYSIEAWIRSIIARRLGLSIGGIEDANVIASKISQQLDGVKYLLLFEDVKEDIRLETIGIPPNSKDSKIVFATNFPFVCPFGEVHNINIEKLSEGDSWQLFENVFVRDNNTIIHQRPIKTIARNVVKSCDGHFTLLKKVARSFKSKRSAETWSNGLKILSRSPQKGDMHMQAVENYWHCSYDDLEENQKACFLFSLLYPKDEEIPVDCLLDCWAAHNLVEYGVQRTSGVIGNDILEQLLAKALFGEGSNEQHVTIEGVCWEAAFKILQEHDKIKCIVAQEALERLQNDDCKDIHWISCANSENVVLHDKVCCPKLTTLFLQRNSNQETISRSFFDEMKKLIILDLYKIRIKSIPMSNLRNLKVLYINGCDMLNALPFKIADPDNILEVLDIRSCIINKIPDDIKNLTRLRRLLVSIISGCDIDGGGTLKCLEICDLSALKELIIDVKPVIHQKYDRLYVQWRNRVIGYIIDKIDTLKELTRLQFRFKDDYVDVLQVMDDTLKIFVPEQGNLKGNFKEKINLHYGTLQVYIGFQTTSKPEVPQYFSAYESFVLCSDNLAYDLELESVLDKVKTLIMIDDNSSRLAQRRYKIQALVQNDGFSKLETLCISECSELKVLFSKKVFLKLMSLKHLEIRDCSAIEEINMLSTRGDDILPELTTLVLHNLRMLTKICSDMKWPKLITLEIHKCPMLTEMPLNEDSAPNLETIKVEEQWWVNLQIDSFRQYFQGRYDFSD